MTELVGYLDRWSVAPGETVDVRLSSDRPTLARLDLIRLGRGSERSEPGGIVFEPVAEFGAQTLEIHHQCVDAGSHARFDGLSSLALEQGTLGLLVSPWCVAGDEQTVAALRCGPTLLCVVIDENGHFAVRVGDAVARTAQRALPRHWVAMALSWTPSAVRLQVMDQRLGRWTTAQVQHGCPWGAASDIMLAGAPMHDGSVGMHFDGRLERPVLWREPPTQEAVHAALLQHAGHPAGAVACWDFAPGDEQMRVLDIGPCGLHGRLVQGPKRAVRGARWTGEVFDWHHAPAQYAAVHFHRDDLIDAGWTVTACVRLPSALPSGAYALRVRCGPGADPPADQGDTPDAMASLTEGQCRLPIFVRAPKCPPGALHDTVAVVFPTLTYLAYGNDRCALHGHNPEVLADCVVALEPTDVLLSRHPEWGLSLYDTHHDGSGVSVASRRRPIPGFQPDQRAWQAGEGSGRWNYPGDLLLVEWLERERIPWHALTDEDVHALGVESLSSYRVVLTGNHPEYATPQMVTAYRRFIDDGGRLMYLGGNGFYWKVACHPEAAGVIELRRAEDGNRSWAEEPGEYYHAFDGAYGGLWRRSGLAPQAWLGVGYAGQGFRRSAGYRRTDEAGRPEVAFVFDGVPADVFGLQGAIGGGCAGIEVDRHDETLGSDLWAWRIATSLPFDGTYLVANEELLVSRPTISAEYSPAVRADVVLQPTPGGGAVFSTGSIAWMGGLAAEGGDAAVQRITGNVLRRFLQPEPLVSEPDRWQDPEP